MRKQACLLTILLVGLLLAGCAARARTPRILDEWGRAARVGASAYSTPAGLAASPDGEYVALAWPARESVDAPDKIHLFVTDRNGQVVFDQALSPTLLNPKAVSLLLGGDGQLELFWLAGDRQARAVWHARLPALETLSQAAPPALQPEPLSSPEGDVATYCVDLLPSGDWAALWVDADGRLVVRPAGRTDPLELASGVLGADVKFDRQGRGHLAWMTRESVTRVALHYGLVDSTGWTLESPHQVTTIILGPDAPRDAVDGPVVALEDDWLYLGWTRQVVTQVSATRQLYLVSLPLEQAAGMGGPVEASLVSLPALFPPPLAPATGAYPFQQLSPVSSRALGGTPVEGVPRTLRGQHDEVALALPVLYSTRTRQAYQPTLLFLKDGAVLGSQALTWTDRPSLDPVIASDAEHNLYLAWNDAIGEPFNYPIYLASTAAGLHAKWDRLTIDDYSAIGLDLANRLTSGVGFMPLGAIWLALGFCWMIVVMILSRGDLYGNRGRVALLTGLWAYWAVKYLTTFDILTFLPSLSYVSPEIGTALIFLVPLFVLALCVGVVGLLYIRRSRQGFSTMQSFALIVLLDWALSLGIYAVGYYE